MNLLDHLNPEQRFAVSFLHGPLCVLAGAGSGKTRVITHRIAHLIQNGVPADAILGVTFTNKAAAEMRDRVWRLTGLGGTTLTTFHSFCARVLRRDFGALGRRTDFTIYDQDDSRAICRDIIGELKLDDDIVTPGALQEYLSAQRNARPGSAPGWSGRSWKSLEEDLARATTAYRARLAESNALDFDELLAETVRLWDTCPDVLAAWRARITHVLVDEFQDTNQAQYRLVSLLTATSRNLCVTGDPDQSIYRWRGADPENFDDFHRDYAGAEEVVLSQNYRSTNAILRAASDVMRPSQNRVPKSLWSELGPGELVKVIRYGTDREEADAIADAVIEHERAGYPRSSQAIMFRVNSLTLPIERALLARGVRYRMIGGPEFFGRTEVRDILAYLRIIANPFDTQALLRILNVPSRGIGDRTRDALVAAAREADRPVLDLIARRAWPAGLLKRSVAGLDRFADVMDRLAESHADRVGDLVDDILALTDYAEWWTGRATKGGSLDPMRNLGQFMALAHEFQRDFGTDVRAFLEHTALIGDAARDDDIAERVTLLTIHAAKGLEFDAVTVVGVEEDLIPHVISQRDPGGTDEERRLLHVAMTRARRRLILTVADWRQRFGKEQRGEPSRFLQDIGEESVEFVGGGMIPNEAAGGGRHVEVEPDRDDLSLSLRPGSKVRHAEFGAGVVVRVRGRARGVDATVVVRFANETERALLLRYANLTVLDTGGGDDDGYVEDDIAF